MIVHDISVNVTKDIVTWENREVGFAPKWMDRIGPKSDANVSRMEIGAHTGTHLDAPLHFVAGGLTVAELDITTLVGPAQVITLLDRAQITSADFERAQISPDTSRLILKTDNTRRNLLPDTKFHTDYVGVAPSGAQWLVAHGIRLIGVDYLSVGSYGPDNIETHQILLSAGIVIVEGLALSQINPGHYFFAALPPKVVEIEGSPCRAVLIEGLSDVRKEK